MENHKVTMGKQTNLKDLDQRAFLNIPSLIGSYLLNIVHKHKNKLFPYVKAKNKKYLIH